MLEGWNQSDSEEDVPVLQRMRKSGNEPHGMWFRQKDEVMSVVPCLSPKKKRKKEEAMGKGRVSDSEERGPFVVGWVSEN